MLSIPIGLTIWNSATAAYGAWRGYKGSKEITEANQLSNQIKEEAKSVEPQFEIQERQIEYVLEEFEKWKTEIR